MEEELIEEIDWDGNTVAVRTKSEFKKLRFPHKVSLVIPKGKNGKFIFSKRGAEQEPWPGTWVCGIGGKVFYGQSYEEAAVRECEEEAGVSLDVEFVSKFKYSDEKYKAIFQVFTTKEEVEVKSLKPDPREVQEFEEMNLEEVQKEIEKNPDKYAPTFIVAFRSFVEGIR